MLETEFQYFDAHRREWVDMAEGKFALIKGTELVGFFESDHEAFKEGSRRFGLQPFMIHEVAMQERKVFIPRLSVKNAGH